MRIPRRHIAGFVKEIATQCFSSRKTRINRGIAFENYFTVGSSDTTSPSLFNKVYESLDNVESLLYSPVSLRFVIGDPDEPNIKEKAKGKRAAAKIRNYAERSETDTMISAAVRLSLKKGKGFIKMLWQGDGFEPSLVSPDDLGVLQENVTSLGKGMEAFAHQMQITPWAFARLVANHRKRDDLIKEARRYTRSSTGEDMQKAASKTVTVGGLYPFQPAGGQSGSGMATTRGVVDWLTQPTPEFHPEVEQSLLDLDEVWIWDDDRNDWATFQLVGGKMLIMGEDQIINALAYDTQAAHKQPAFEGQAPLCGVLRHPVESRHEFLPSNVRTTKAGRSAIIANHFQR